MAERIHRFNIVSPPNSPLAFATTERTDFPPGVVTAITIEIPSGHAGKTGIAIFYAATQLIPRSGSAYIKGNKKTTRYELDDPHPGGEGWFVQHFNAGRRPHTFHLAIEMDELVGVLALPPPVLLLRQFGESFTVPVGTTGGTGTGTGGGAVSPV